MNRIRQMKGRQLEIARETRKLEGQKARKPRRILLLTRICIATGLCLSLGGRHLINDFSGSSSLILPAAVMCGLLLDALRSV